MKKTKAICYIGLRLNTNAETFRLKNCNANPKGYHLDVVGGPSIPHDPESDAGGS
jgi:hypothetical protein